MTDDPLCIIGSREALEELSSDRLPLEETVFCCRPVSCVRMRLAESGTVDAPWRVRLASLFTRADVIVPLRFNRFVSALVPIAMGPEARAGDIAFVRGLYHERYRRALWIDDAMAFGEPIAPSPIDVLERALRDAIRAANTALDEIFLLDPDDATHQPLSFLREPVGVDFEELIRMVGHLRSRWPHDVVHWEGIIGLMYRHTRCRIQSRFQEADAAW